METIPFETIHNWWGGKLIIRKMSPYKDNRGLLCEVFRKDSDSFGSIVNTYISETKPFVKRGPHEHKFQTDEFITWNSRMIYEFFNPETNESKFFVTEPEGIFSVHVANGIHHGYRNIDYKKTSYTLNSLDKLFKGEGRVEEPDEVRHEKKTVNNKVLFIFGANGKLGKSLTDIAYKEVGEHTFDIIPFFDKLLSNEEVNEFFNNLDTIIKDKDVTFVNCAALTNTKESVPLNPTWVWANINLPLLFAEKCSERNWKFIQFSTDYVYQEVKPGIVNYYVSTYTQSKKELELVLKNANSNKTMTTSVLRVSNLFKDSPDDNNIFTRFKSIIETNKGITIDPDLEVAPTNVDELSKKLIDLFKTEYFKVKKLTFINVLTPSLKLDEFVESFFETEGLTITKTPGKLLPWMNKFKNDLSVDQIHL